jgi:hypothetical protein
VNFVNVQLVQKWSNRVSSESDLIVRQPVGLSYFWDFALPLSVAGVPMAVFSLIGWLVGGFDQRGREMPGWVIGAMMVLLTAGIVAMAIVAFVRYGLGMVELQSAFPRGPAQWRSLCLFLGVLSLTLFEIIANVGAMASAGFLLVVATPFYIAYLLLIRIALWRRRGTA